MSSEELKRLATLKRGDSEEIRWSFDQFTNERGDVSKFIHARKWFLGKDGDWHPTRAGVTIRINELDDVVEALQRVQRARDKAK